MENEAGESLTKRERRELAKQEKIEERNRQETSSKTKKILIWVVVLAALGWLGYKGYQYFASSAPETNRIAIETVEGDHIKGNKEAKVTLIEYGDFQCPSCGAYYPLVKNLLGDFPSELRVIYRHFPLTQIHKNAMSAAKAVEAAGKQEKFWEMHDVMFEKQAEWSELSDAKEKFLEYARQLGLNEEKFLEDFDSKETQEKINSEIASGNRLGVNATPTFYLSGAKVAPRNYVDFKGLVEDAIKDSSK